MAVESREGLIEKKAFSYLMSYFYSEEVKVTQGPVDPDIDLMIEIPKGNKWLGWKLAVQVRGYLNIPSVPELNRVASAISRRHNLDELLFPLVLCAVEVRAPRGFYSWILEPVVEEKQPRLKHPVTYEWGQINVESVHEMYVKTTQYWGAWVHKVRT
jgi:hypothetical protein